MKKKTAGFFLAALMALSMILAGCGSGEEGQGGSGGGDFSAVAGDYYLDLSQLGMKLTIYLRLSPEGAFQFSNTTDFAVNKSSGTVQQGTEEYIMVYSSVNGEEKSVSDGLTSSFTVKEDGSLDFSGCERIYYGSATAVSRSEEDPSVVLTAVPLPEGYQELETESDFVPGTYTAQGEGISYTLSFYEDSSYLLMAVAQGENGPAYTPETGSYGVSTTQLALTPAGLSRLSGEVISGTELLIPVAAEGTEERTSLTFRLQGTAEETAVLTGQTGGTAVTVTLYSDNSYRSSAGGFEEGGVWVPDSASGTFKIYPDHPETGVRGLNQIATVPSGAFSWEDGRLTLTDFRVRASESLSRDKAAVSQE